MHDFKCAMKVLVIRILLLCIMLAASIQIVCAQTSSLILNPTNTNKAGNDDCEWSNGTKGICIQQKYCTADHYIAENGIIHDTELRARQCQQNYWCCVLRNSTDSDEETDPPRVEDNRNTQLTNIQVTGDSSCTLIDSDDCPWCVTLHKGTLNDMGDTGLFCMGSMIGPKIVLTTASCLSFAGNSRIPFWAQVPTSANPRRKYMASNTKRHPNYNSGTHEYDLGLMILDENVDWGTEKWKGACLGINGKVEGGCEGFGFDGNDQLVSTLLTAKHGGCSVSGNTSDVACVRKNRGEDYCLIAPGSPVSCNGRGDVTGVARNPCISDAALVGRLAPASDWITTELKQQNLLLNDYLTNKI